MKIKIQKLQRQITFYEGNTNLYETPVVVLRDLMQAMILASNSKNGSMQSDPPPPKPANKNQLNLPP